MPLDHGADDRQRRRGRLVRADGDRPERHGRRPSTPGAAPACAAGPSASREWATGHRLVGHLVEAGAKVVICDVSAGAIEAVRARHPEVRAVADAEALIAEELDILAPGALGGTLNEQAARRSPRVSSAAPPTSARPSRHRRLLAYWEILDAPDYVVNSGGVIQAGGMNWPASTSIAPAPPASRSSLPPASPRPRGHRRWRRCRRP